MLATFLDTLMISLSRGKSWSNIWPLELKRILCFETSALIAQWRGADLANKSWHDAPLLCFGLYKLLHVVFKCVCFSAVVFLYAALHTLTFPCVTLNVWFCCVPVSQCHIAMCCCVRFRVPAGTSVHGFKSLLLVCMPSWFYELIALIFVCVCVCVCAGPLIFCVLW
jgi:hypothetical protein